MAHENENRVSVSWKWLAVTLVGVLIAFGGADRAWVGRVLERHEDTIATLKEQIAKLPTKDDFRRLEDALRQP